MRKPPIRSSRRSPTNVRTALTMPGNPRAIIAEAEQRFPVRIIIRVPGDGIGTRYAPMTENCGIHGWSITPAGTRGIRNDAIAVFMNGPTCAVAFVARWRVLGDPPGFYEFRN